MPRVAEPIDEYLPTTPGELCRWMAENADGEQRPVYPVGGRTALRFGYPAAAPGITLSTAQLARVVDYPARDMTITVEAGIRMDDLAAVLKRERQRLAVDVAQAHRATLGGAIATNTSGPRRYGLGTLRDYVIGVSAVDALGRPFKAGGRVVKNVAGYDLCKALVGSLGTLGVITQATLKLRPAPEASALVWAAFDRLSLIDAALARLAVSSTRPMALELLLPGAATAIAAEAGLDLPAHRPVLCIGVEGAPHEVQWQIDELTSELAEFHPHDLVAVNALESLRLWFALTEYQVASDEPLTFQASVRPSQAVEFAACADQLGISVQAHAGNGIVLGHLSDRATTLAAAHSLLAPLYDFVRRAHGVMTILNCPPDWAHGLPLFGDLSPAWELMRRLKSQLDPKNLLNPERFFGRTPRDA